MSSACELLASQEGVECVNIAFPLALLLHFKMEGKIRCWGRLGCSTSIWKKDKKLMTQGDITFEILPEGSFLFFWTRVPWGTQPTCELFQTGRHQGCTDLFFWEDLVFPVGMKWASGCEEWYSRIYAKNLCNKRKVLPLICKNTLSMKHNAAINRWRQSNKLQKVARFCIFFHLSCCWLLFLVVNQLEASPMSNLVFVNLPLSLLWFKHSTQRSVWHTVKFLFLH